MGNRTSAAVNEMQKHFPALRIWPINQSFQGTSMAVISTYFEFLFQDAPLEDTNSRSCSR